MTHVQVRLRLSAYLEADLSHQEEASLEAHLAECTGCAAELRALRRAIELLHALPAAEPSHDIAAAVMASLRGSEARPARFSWPFLQWFGDEAWLGKLAPVAAAFGVGAVAWLLTPDLLPQSVSLIAAEAPARVEAERSRQSPTSSGIPMAAGAKAAPARALASLPTMQVCLERARLGDPAKDGCAAWYSWFLAKAFDDAGSFADEVDRLPAKARGPWLGRLSEFAQRSGSAHLVGDRLRSSRDPGAVRIAKRFERRGGLVQQASWAGR